MSEKIRGYFGIPKDFPRADLIDDVLINYQLCQDLVCHVVDEVRKEQRRHPLVPPSEIVEMHLEVARRFGWGCVPGEIEWIFRNVVHELGCDMPNSTRK